MDRRRYGTGDTRSRYHLEREGPTWLYDPITEEFLPDPGFPTELGPDSNFLIWEDTPRALPRSRGGLLVHWLFVRGWMSIVLILGLMLFGVGAWALGYH